MINALRFPLDIQLFGQGQDPAPAASPETPAPTAVVTPEVDYEQLATVVSKRTSGTEDKVLQGYFKSQGLSQEQANEAMAQYKTTQATKQQEAALAQQKIVQENAKLKEQIQNSQIDAKVAELAATLGVHSDKLPFLNKLVDRSNAAKEDGTLNDENIKASIETVLKAFPDFKSTAQSGGFRQIGGNGNQDSGGSAVDDALDAAFGIKKK